MPDSCFQDSQGSFLGSQDSLAGREFCDAHVGVSLFLEHLVTKEVAMDCFEPWDQDFVTVKWHLTVTLASFGGFEKVSQVWL